MYSLYHPKNITFPTYLFFTGKGGVGKTSIACGTALSLAESGKKVLLVSTDPASNLQDVFAMDLGKGPTKIPNVPNLAVANLNPEEAAKKYREKVIAPYKDKLPAAVIGQMEEQLSGACTVEIAAFDEFSVLVTDEKISETYDHILFDTAPTGHTLRLLQLPTAWSGFLEESPHGASCLGPLAGLEAKKELYEATVEVLSNPSETVLFLVARADFGSLQEANRAAEELADVGITNQELIINGLLAADVSGDEIANAFYRRQQMALETMPKNLQSIKTWHVMLAPFNVTGLQNLSRLFTSEGAEVAQEIEETPILPGLQKLVDDLHNKGKRIIFTMGKGGVGKTTIASAVAIGLAKKGVKVHLTTTDPAAHIDYVAKGAANHENVTTSKIDPKIEVKKYQEYILSLSSDMLDEEGLAYLEEDLRSPCTEEIAIFRAFAEIVDKSEEEIVVIDTAPTGHTLLLLDAANSYHKEIERATGEIPISVEKLLPRLRNEQETSVLIVTLAEATPVYEASRLQDDLVRSGITPDWWVINQSLSQTKTTNPILRGRAKGEATWVKEATKKSNNKCIILPWQPEEPIGYEKLKNLFAE